MTEAQSCVNCIYWYLLKLDGEGVCRRYPPKTLIDPEDNTTFHIFPRIEGVNWCGEWRIDSDLGTQNGGKGLSGGKSRRSGKAKIA